MRDLRKYNLDLIEFTNQEFEMLCQWIEQEEPKWLQDKDSKCYEKRLNAVKNINKYSKLLNKFNKNKKG